MSDASDVHAGDGAPRSSHTSSNACHDHYDHWGHHQLQLLLLEEEVTEPFTDADGVADDGIPALGMGSSSTPMPTMLDQSDVESPDGEFCNENDLYDLIGDWNDDLGIELLEESDEMLLDSPEEGLPAAIDTTSPSPPHQAPRARPISPTQRPAAIGAASLAKAKHVPISAIPTMTKKRTDRRAEIVTLRNESERLEKKLYELREFWKLQAVAAKVQEMDTAAEKSGAAGTSNSSVLVCAEPLWKPIAIQQRELLSKSELENQSLRADLLLQRKMAKKLRKLLLKRAMATARYENVFYSMHPSTPQQVLAENRHIFQKLCSDIAPMHTDFRRVQNLIKARERDTHTFRDLKVQQDPTNGLFFEVVDCFALPFDRLQVNQAIRRLYSDDRQWKTINRLREYFDSSGDTMVCQSLAKYINPAGSGYIRMKEVVQNYSDDTQSVFLVITLTEPVTAAGEPIPALSIREQKWIVVRSSRGREDGLVKNGAPSIVQTYHMVTPEAIYEGYEGAWSRKLLASFGIAWDATLTDTRRRLDSFLIEQEMETRKRFQEGVIVR